MTAPIPGLTSVNLTELVAQARAIVQPPADSAVALEGSLAEGFGNETSDVDLVFLSGDPGSHPAMPTVVFLQDRRVEVRVRTLDEGFRQLKQVTGAAARGRKSLSGISRDLIDRVQRIGNALLIEATEPAEGLRAACASPAVARIIHDWYRSSADDAILTADALCVLGDEASARSWCRTAGIHTVKAWLAERGDTYIESKWYGRQLRRTPGGPELLAELESLVGAPEGGGGLPELVAAVADFRARHVAGSPVGIGGQLVVRPNRRVTTWRIGRTVHIVDPGHSVFLLGDTAERVWCGLPFGLGLAEVVRHYAESGLTDAGRVLGELHRLGLIRLAVRGRGVLESRPASAALPLESTPGISVDGAVRPDGFDPTWIRPLPISAAAFVKAGMGLVWANVVVENALEDIAGALKKQEWALLGVATRRCVRFLCAVALSAHGVAPGPADEETVSVAGRLGVLPRHLWTAAETLVARAVARDADEAAAIVESLRELVAEVRSGLPGGGGLPSSFDGADGWSDTLAVGGDWIRLATYLGIRPPKEDAQDLIATDSRAPGAK
jgi:hypothetical protein